MTTLQTFNEQREAVAVYIRDGMKSQGATPMQAVDATTALYFFDSRDVENLYRAITSKLKPEIITAIVAHDFNGLANHDPYFLPKSRQFEVKA